MAKTKYTERYDHVTAERETVDIVRQIAKDTDRKIQSVATDLLNRGIKQIRYAQQKGAAA